MQWEVTIYCRSIKTATEVLSKIRKTECAARDNTPENSILINSKGHIKIFTQDYYCWFDLVSFWNSCGYYPVKIVLQDSSVSGTKFWNFKVYNKLICNSFRFILEE